MRIVCLLAALTCAADPKPTVTIRPAAEPTRVEVTAILPAKTAVNLPSGRLTAEQGETVLRLLLVSSDDEKDPPAILGTYDRRDTTLSFQPHYPLLPGQRYRAVLDLGDGKPITAEYRVPARQLTPPAVVEKVYPSSSDLPANLLKFYIHFSKPMRESRDIFDHFHLLGPDGKEVEDPWRHTELWSADGKRLTLYFQPGRVKRGVNLREEIGPPLESNRRYTLLIDNQLRDAEGQPLAKFYRKEFRTTAEESTRIRLEDWRVLPPAAGTMQPLVLQFPRPLDRALLERFLMITDPGGRPIQGRIEVGPEEKSWRFLPERPWQKREHGLTVDGRLEDLAGNTPLAAFDLDLEKPGEEATRLRLLFRPASRPE